MVGIADGLHSDAVYTVARLGAHQIPSQNRPARSRRYLRRTRNHAMVVTQRGRLPCEAIIKRSSDGAGCPSPRPSPAPARARPQPTAPRLRAWRVQRRPFHCTACRRCHGAAQGTRAAAPLHPAGKEGGEGGTTVNEQALGCASSSWFHVARSRSGKGGGAAAG